jgi:hypothetical protein
MTLNKIIFKINKYQDYKNIIKIINIYKFHFNKNYQIIIILVTAIIKQLNNIIITIIT